MLTLVLLIFLLLRYKKNETPSQKYGYIYWFFDYIGFVLVTACFYVAWSFGLPATRPLNLGPLRLLFQLIFIVACALCGLLMVVFFCLFSMRVRKTLRCCRRNIKENYDVYNPDLHAQTVPPVNAYDAHVFAMSDKPVDVGFFFENDNTSDNLSFEKQYDEAPTTTGESDADFNKVADVEDDGMGQVHFTMF